MKKIYLLSAILFFSVNIIFAQATVELKHDCDPDPSSGLGIGNGDWSAMVCFDDVELGALYDDHAFTELKLYMIGNSANWDTVVIKLFEDYELLDTLGTTWIVDFGTEIYSADILSEVTPGQWTVHSLPDSIHIQNGKKYAIRVDLSQQGPGNILALDSCSMVPKKGGWVWASNIPHGNQLVEFAIDRNLCIRATAEEETPPVNSILETGNYNFNATVYPNPVAQNSFINFEMPVAETLSLNIYSITGQLVTTLLDNEKISLGSHSVSLAKLNLSNGIYTYTLQSRSSITTGKFVVSY